MDWTSLRTFVWPWNMDKSDTEIRIFSEQLALYVEQSQIKKGLVMKGSIHHVKEQLQSQS